MSIGWATRLKLAVVGLAAVCALVSVPPAFIERWFSTGVYPAIQGAMTPASNLVPFAVFDVLSLMLLVGFVFVVVRTARAARRATFPRSASPPRAAKAAP